MSNPRGTSKAPADPMWFWVFLAGIIAGGWTLFWAGQAIVGPGVSFNPVALFQDALTPGTEVTVSTGGLVVSLVLFALLVVVITVIMGLRAKKKATRKGASIVHATKHMATKRQISSMSRKAVTESAARTNPDLPDSVEPGQLIGRELGTGKEVWLDYETLTVDMWAARYGKTTGRVLPQFLSAPGGVVGTGNKPDLVEDSIAARSAVGDCLVCDPQRIWMAKDQAPDFTVDLLDFIRRRPADEWDSASVDLAVLFANNAGVDIGSGGQGEEWRTSGAQLLSCFLLAATLTGRQVTEILDWVYDESDREVIDILRDHGFPSIAMQAKGTYDLTEKTRSGIFFSIQYMVAPLAKKSMQRWVTPQPGVRRFNPTDFIADHEAGKSPTLYLLSDPRSAGSASLLVLALVVWITEEAEDASRRNGGRLRIPLVMPLDEAANVVKWGQLAEVYSHFGSKGILISSIFQSFRQPKRIYGEDNAHDMMTNATLIIGGGIKDKAFLEEAVSFVGEYQHQQFSVSTDSSSFNTSTSASERDRAILTAADLRGLDAHLMLVIPQKSAPMIVEAVPFWERPLREQMRNADRELGRAQKRAEALAVEESVDQAVA
ncbi:MAG: type IV secretory system conjugative DNA transfer family protein [Micrococcaceae bacterium]